MWQRRRCLDSTTCNGVSLAVEFWGSTLTRDKPKDAVPSTPERSEGLRACYWEGPSELPERRSSSSAPRLDSAEPRCVWTVGLW